MENVMSKIVELRKELEKREKFYREKLDQFKGLRNDYNHLLELGNLDAISIMKVSSIYRKKLRERRQYKDKLLKIKKFNGVFNKHKDFFQELDYVLNKENENEAEDRKYFARSEIGQELINEFACEGDGLVTSPDTNDIEKLKITLENKTNN